MSAESFELKVIALEALTAVEPPARLPAMLVAAVRTEVPLAAERGIVTWLDVAIRHDTTEIGAAHVALIRVADALNHGLVIRNILAEVLELRVVYELVFDHSANYLKPQFQNTAGWNVMYFQRIEARASWIDRCVQEAAVKRLIDTWGEGCAIAIMSLPDAAAASRWSRIGFEVLQEPRAREPGYAWLDLSLPHPAVRSTDRDGDRFEVVDRA